MQVRLDRELELQEVDRLEIVVGDIIYRISETSVAYKEEGNLRINKCDYEGSNQINIVPCVGNEIIIK